MSIQRVFVIFPPPGPSGKNPVSSPSLSAFPALLERRKWGEGSTTQMNLWGSLCPSQGSLHPSRGDWSPHGGQGLGHLAGSPRPSWALPTLRRPRGNIAPSVPTAPSRTRAWPSLAPHSGKPRSRSSPSAHLARLVELLLQPRHGHSAFRCGTSRPDPGNRRYSASDRFPGAAEPPRASTGRVGAASAALSPAPRPSGRSLSPSRARAARILHGNRTLPAPAPSEHARAPCR